MLSTSCPVHAAFPPLVSRRALRRVFLFHPHTHAHFCDTCRRLFSVVCHRAAQYEAERVQLPRTPFIVASPRSRRCTGTRLETALVPVLSTPTSKPTQPLPLRSLPAHTHRHQRSHAHSITQHGALLGRSSPPISCSPSLPLEHLHRRLPELCPHALKP